MTTPPDFARRKARGGKGLIPPNPKQWDNEHNGLDLRDDLDCALDEPLSHLEAFDLLDDVVVCAHGDVPFDAHHQDHLRRNGAWSGMAIPMNDMTLVLYNDAHPETRTRSTLMEEFFHLRLGHKPSVIRVHSENGRTYDRKIEDQAFGSGAAALVPYKSLRTLLARNENVPSIASRFRVSEALVRFRMKVTKLYKRHA